MSQFLFLNILILYEFYEHLLYLKYEFKNILRQISGKNLAQETHAHVVK